MKAIEMFPYWADNRGLLHEALQVLREEDLDARPAPGLRSIGEILRHIITTEEYWWHGGILGEPFARWRPDGWDTWTPAQKDAYRARRFPTLAAIGDGLTAAHAPVEAFLSELDARALCERRRATWGQEHSLRWIFWHLVEHDQHHRAQVFTRLRLVGRQAPAMFPRPAVMAQTPAACWRGDDVDVCHVAPFWSQVRRPLYDAVAALRPEDLAARPAAGWASVHDITLHIVIWEDFLIRQTLRGEVGQPWWRLTGQEWRLPVHHLAEQVGAGFPSVPTLLEALHAVADATDAVLRTVRVEDLAVRHATPWGPHAVHHVLWYAREHLVHHRAQLFFRMRLLGLVPPDI